MSTVISYYNVPAIVISRGYTIDLPFINKKHIISDDSRFRDDYFESYEVIKNTSNYLEALNMLWDLYWTLVDNWDYKEFEGGKREYFLQVDFYRYPADTNKKSSRVKVIDKDNRIPLNKLIAFIFDSYIADNINLVELSKIDLKIFDTVIATRVHNNQYTTNMKTGIDNYINNFVDVYIDAYFPCNIPYNNDPAYVKRMANTIGRIIDFNKLNGFVKVCRTDNEKWWGKEYLNDYFSALLSRMCEKSKAFDPNKYISDRFSKYIAITNRDIKFVGPGAVSHTIKQAEIDGQNVYEMLHSKFGVSAEYEFKLENTPGITLNAYRPILIELNNIIKKFTSNGITVILDAEEDRIINTLYILEYNSKNVYMAYTYKDGTIYNLIGWDKPTNPI